jgi:hypothetical protein
MVSLLNSVIIGALGFWRSLSNFGGEKRESLIHIVGCRFEVQLFLGFFTFWRHSLTNLS